MQNRTKAWYLACGKLVTLTSGWDRMAAARAKQREASRPALHRGDEGGPLSRELITVKLVRLVDFQSRAASLAFPRVSGLSDFEWRVVAWACETPGLSLNDLAAL